MTVVFVPTTLVTGHYLVDAMSAEVVERRDSTSIPGVGRNTRFLSTSLNVAIPTVGPTVKFSFIFYSVTFSISMILMI